MSYYKIISYNAARELILAHRVRGWGRTFSVAWMRRTDSKDGKRKANNQEVITGRFGVTKHLKSRKPSEAMDGTGLPCRGAAYDRAAHGLFCFWSTSRKYEGVSEPVAGYRCIPFDRLTWLKLDGVVYRVGEFAPPAQH